MLGGTISVQVLNEIANVLRRKMQMSWPDTHLFLDMIRALLTVEPVTVATHEMGQPSQSATGFPSMMR